MSDLTIEQLHTSAVIVDDVVLLPAPHLNAVLRRQGFVVLTPGQPLRPTRKPSRRRRRQQRQAAAQIFERVLDGILEQARITD